MQNQDYNLAIWVYPDELGKEKEIRFRGRIITVKLPVSIDGASTLRLRGLGRTTGGVTGNLLITVNLLDDAKSGRRKAWKRKWAGITGGINSFIAKSRSVLRLCLHLASTRYAPASCRRCTPASLVPGGLMVIFGIVLSVAAAAGLYVLSPFAGPLLIIAGIFLMFYGG